MTEDYPMSVPATAVADLVRAHRNIDAPSTFELLGMEWDLLPGVYAPQLTQSAALYAEWLPYPMGGELCEVGCGSGYLSVLAALRGCARVTALDVNPAAVDNTRRNATRHGVADRVEARHGDLFAPLGPDDRYDVIFWNSNFVELPADTDLDHLAQAFYDPGYATHERFLAGARAHLHANGAVLLGFTDLGNRDRLAALTDRYGWQVSVLRAAPCATPDGSIEYQLLSLRPA
jgi:release factor glutamine methyltransferase